MLSANAQSHQHVIYQLAYTSSCYPSTRSRQPLVHKEPKKMSSKNVKVNRYNLHLSIYFDLCTIAGKTRQLYITAWLYSYSGVQLVVRCPLRLIVAHSTGSMIRRMYTYLAGDDAGRDAARRRRFAHRKQFRVAEDDRLEPEGVPLFGADRIEAANVLEDVRRYGDGRLQSLGVIKADNADA